MRRLNKLWWKGFVQGLASFLVFRNKPLLTKDVAAVTGDFNAALKALEQVKPKPCTREEWFRLPLELRRRWWRETDYSKNRPSPELREAMEKALKNIRSNTH